MEKDEHRSGGSVRSILFVCTANIFRSMTAEYALKARIGEGTSFIVRSAGINAKPQPVHAWVQTRLREKGANPGAHLQRQLTKEVFDDSDLVIAMGRDHQTYIREQFGRDVPLFNQVCLGHDKPILDLHEAIPDWESDLERAHAYVWAVIDMIWATTPALLPRLR